MNGEKLEFGKDGRILINRFVFYELNRKKFKERKKFIGKKFINFFFRIKRYKKLFELFSNEENFVVVERIFEFRFEILVVILGIVTSLYSEVFLKLCENLFSFDVIEVRRLLFIDSLSFGEFIVTLIFSGYELGYMLSEGNV